MFVTVYSTIINNLKQRIVKFLGWGKNDTKTSFEVSPYGLDSNAINKTIALHCPTSDKGKTVILGYLNTNQKAGIGEMRIFATDGDGIEKFYVWLKSNGIIEIGGDVNYAVKYNELETEFNKLKDSYNDLADKWNQFCTAYTPGSPSVLGTPPTLSTSTVLPNTSDITNTKNDKIKTI